MKINKKITYLSLGIIIAAFFVFVGTKIGDNNCEKKVSNDFLENKSPDQCKEKLKNMDNSELTKNILDSFSNVDANGNPKLGYFKIFYNMDLMSKYLLCQYENSNDDNEKDRIFKNEQLIIKQDAIKKEKEKNVISLSEENFKNPSGSFIYVISVDNFQKYCPEKLPQMCKRENGTFFKETDEWCEDICSMFEQYKNNDEYFNREIINFSNMDNTLKNSIVAYVWRINFAFGLKGREAAAELCNKTNDNVRSICLEYIRRVEIRSMKCDGLKEKVIDGFCDS